MNQYQISNATAYNRYPFLWNLIRARIQPRRILSIGCSSGEECITALAYFPDAHVYGTDKNATVLQIARLVHSNDRITYIDEPTGTYDLVLCNSVLCNHPTNNGKSFNDLMSFESFKFYAMQISEFMGSGAILMAANCEYNIGEAVDLEPISNAIKHQCTIFDPIGNKSKDQKMPAVWRKK